MVHLTYIIPLLLLSISGAQKLSSRGEDPEYIVLSVYTETEPNELCGYLSSTGHIVKKAFDYKVAQTVYALSSDQKLVSYDSSAKDKRTLIGVVGTKKDVSNVLLATVPQDQVKELAPISTDWTTVQDNDNHQKLEWTNPSFPGAGHAAYFCATKNGAIGAEVYAVFSTAPKNCLNVTLDLGGGE